MTDLKVPTVTEGIVVQVAATYELEYAYKRMLDGIDFIEVENPSISGVSNLRHWAKMFYEAAQADIEAAKNERVS